MRHVLLTAADHVVFFLRVKGHDVAFKLVIVEVPDTLARLVAFVIVLVLPQELHEVLVDTAGRGVLVQWQVAVTDAAVQLMRLVVPVFDRVLLPLAGVLVTVGAAAAAAVHRTRSACSLSFKECLLDGLSLKQLHVEVSREDEADFVSNLGRRVDRDHQRNVTLEQDIRNFLRVTGRHEGQLDSVVFFIAKQVKHPLLIEPVNLAVSDAFKLQIELLGVFLEVTMAGNVDD